MPLELVVLAAGIGSRFGGDKQVEGFGPGGETLLELNTYDAIRAGADSVAWITRPDLVPALDQLAKRIPRAVSVRVDVQSRTLRPENEQAPQRSRPWGTAHAWRAAGRNNHTTMVVNADDLYGAHAMSAVADALAKAAPGPYPVAWIGGYQVAETLSPYGGVSRALITAQGANVDALVELENVRRWADGQIRGRGPQGEDVTLDDEDLVSLNLWGFSGPWSDVVDGSLQRFERAFEADSPQEFRIPDVVFEAVSSGVARAFVVPVTSRWVGVTFAADRPHVEDALLEEFRSGTYPTPLFPPPPDVTDACS